MQASVIRYSVLLFLVALGTFGCKRQYSNYCPGALNDNCLNVDGAIALCTSDQECAPDVCDLAGSKTCVQCTSASAAACVGTSPVCGANDKCRACTAHTECPSSACLPDGSCGTDATVAYVDPAGTGTDCTRSSPCKMVADALKTNRPFVKMQGITNEQVDLKDTNVTFLADPGAMLTDTTVGILMKIDGASQVAIHDLTISGALGPNNAGLSLQAGNTSTVSLIHVTLAGNTGGGIVASGGTLTVSDSAFLNNPGGGISIMNGVFTIVGNTFYGNGGVSSFVGGVAIATTMNAANRLDLNTFALNTARDTIGSGIQCVADTFTAKDNIVSDNRNATATTQIGGTCTHAYSLVNPGALPNGATNFGGDPAFVNEATGDLHLQSTSPARGKADPTTDLTGIAAHDIDGTGRTSPADVGAYEFHAGAAPAVDGVPQ